MTYSLGFSPCPNDTFIFDAIVNEKIDTEGVTVEPVLADVEQLNQKAFRNEIDVTKLSYFAFGKLAHEYALLSSGSALGNNCGPLLISKQEVENPAIEVPHQRVAIPGENTTANFLFSLAFPTASQKEVMVFSDIENAVLEGSVDLGVIIHENRFTYQQKGLRKVMDLGEYWEETTQCPIPLGGIAVRRAIPDAEKRKINRIIQRSVQYAFDHPSSSWDYVQKHAQEMDEDVIYRHINLYVNRFTKELGEQGRMAVQTMFEKAVQQGLLNNIPKHLFIG